MSFQKKLLFNSVLAFSTIVVALVAIYNFKLANEKAAMIGAFEEEKILLEAQVNEIILHIDSLKKENDWLKNENNYLLTKLNYEIPSLNALNNSKNNKSNEKGFLEIENKELKEQLLKIEEKISSNQRKINTLERAEVIEYKKKSQLSITNVSARGVRVLTKERPKNKANLPIQELRVCFTIEGSDIVLEGNKKIFIQVTNPYNQIISIDKNSFKDQNGNEVFYSSKVDAFYNQKDTDVCTYVDLEKNKTVKGTYRLKLFYDSKEIGSTTYQYK